MKYPSIKSVWQCILLLVFFLPLTGYAETSLPFNKIVLFGDSLTDNGNLYLRDAGIIPKSPPYFSGRFSNGEVWADGVDHYFREHYNVFTENEALGGETTLTHNPIEGYVPYSLAVSVRGYLWSDIFQDKSRVLYIIWIGANDYFADATDLEQLSSDVVNQIQDTVKQLIQEGGQHFLIINLPDEAESPYGREQEKRETLATLSHLHNTKLSAAILKLQAEHPNSVIREFDVNSIFTDLINNPDKYNKQFDIHITDTKSSCWNGGYSFHSSIHYQALDELKLNFPDGDFNPENLLMMIGHAQDLLESYRMGESYHLGIMPCDKPDEFVFWDHVHPTQVIHKVISNLIIKDIEKFYAK